MSSAEFVSFNFVKKSVTILQILDHYGITQSFKQRGAGLVGPCPIHGGESTDCFRVSPAKNCFNCFGKCKAGGNILDLVSRKEGVTIRKAALLIQEWFKLTPLTEANEKQAAPKEKPAPTKAPEVSDEEPTTPNAPLPFVLKNLDPNHTFLSELGISEEMRKMFGLGFCGKGLLADYIAIPIHNKDGLLVAYAGYCPGEPQSGKGKYKFPPGFRKSVEVFNLHRVIEAKELGPLVVVKDCLTCMKLWELGLKRVVAMMDNSLSKTQADLIQNMVLADGRIVVLFNETEDGRAERLQVVNRLTRSHFVKAPTLAEGRLVEGLTHSEVRDFTL